MRDYIEREAARPDAFCAGVSCQDCPFLKDNLYGGCKVDDFIKSIPAADVQPVKRGTWKHLGGDEWCCDVCGHVISTEGSWENPLLDHGIRFCENCGAKMDADKEKE